MEEFIGPGSVGVVGGLLIILGAGAKGVWIFGYQAKKELDAKDAIIQRLEEQLEAQREGANQRLLEERADKLEWKALAYDLSDLGRRAAAVAEKSVR